MLATATVTVPAIVLHLRGDDGSLGILIDEFLDILEEYQDAKDSLSVALANWGGELAELLANEVSFDAHEIAFKLYELRKILRNPLDGSFLQHPRLAGGRIWEEWMLFQVQELFENVSCYFDRASLEDAEEHAFGEKILRWRDKIFASSHFKTKAIQRELEELEGDEDRKGWLDREESLRSKPQVAIAGYVELAANADQLELWEETFHKVERVSIHFKKVIEASEERTRAHSEALRISLLEGERRLIEDLEGIRATYMRTIQSLRRSLEEARRENIVLEGRVAHAEGRISEMRSRILGLEARVQRAEAENRANYEAAHSGGGGGGCVVM